MVGSIYSCVDFGSNPQAALGIQINGPATSESVKNIVSQIPSDVSLGAVVCAAGGWGGGDASSPELVDTVNDMYLKNVQSAFAGKELTTHLNHYFIFVLDLGVPACFEFPNNLLLPLSLPQPFFCFCFNLYSM